MVCNIRRYENRDLDDVLSAWENASKIAHSFLSREFLELERYNIPNVYLPNAETWVAEQDGKTIGFISLIGQEVGGLFVQPAYQRMGVGRALMDKAQALRGELEVEVFAANTIGRQFYSCYGFEPVGQKIHAETGHELLRLKLTVKEA